jgi:hypothetical protein
MQYRKTRSSLLGNQAPMTAENFANGAGIPCSAEEWAGRGTLGSAEKDAHADLMIYFDNAVAVRETGDTRLHSPVELAVALEVASHVIFSLIKLNAAVRLYLVSYMHGNALPLQGIRRRDAFDCSACDCQGKVFAVYIAI